MSFKVIRIVVLLAVAQPLNSSQFFKQGVRAAGIMSTAGVLGAASAVVYQNHQHKELYYKNLAAKVNKLFPHLAPVSREFLEKHRYARAEKMKQHLFKDEQAGLLKKVSPIVEWYTRLFFFRNGIPICGDSIIRMNNEKYFSAVIAVGEVENHFFTDNYCLVIDENLYRGVQKAFNPFYRLLNKNIHAILDSPVMEDGEPFSYYTLEVAMSPTFLLEGYEATLLHEGQHILDQAYGQRTPGKDITLKNNEIGADNNIQDQNLLSAALFRKNLAKLMRIYLGWARRDHIDRDTESFFLERYSDIYLYDLKKREEDVGGKYHSDNFHPCDNERIALFKARWEGPKKNREVTVTIYYQEPGKEKRVHRTLVLREQDGWEIRL